MPDIRFIRKIRGLYKIIVFIYLIVSGGCRMVATFFGTVTDPMTKKKRPNSLQYRQK